MTNHEKNKKLTTHAVDGGREGIYSLMLTAVCAKLILMLPESAHVAGPELEIAFAVAVSTGVVKFFRNFIRKNWGIYFKGII